jgi:hypothetical protein
LRKNFLDPVDVRKEGKWGSVEVEVGDGEQSIHIRKSMSWQDLVRREGAVVDSLRQLPLLSVSIAPELWYRGFGIQ